MSTIDLSTSTEPRIAVVGHVLAELDAAARRHRIPFMVIGATARDLLSIALTGAPPSRATADVDVAVAIESWQAFEALTAELERRGRRPHTFVVAGLDVDVVPFGGVETGARTIDWDDGVWMSTLGLSEVFAASRATVLPGGTRVQVPSPPGLAALKLSAWSDRRLVTRRDAVDLQTIIGWYQAGPLLDELYEQDVALLEVYEFDVDLASAHRLGRQMADILGVVATRVSALLDDDALGRLSADMLASAADQSAILRALRGGLRGTPPRPG